MLTAKEHWIYIADKVTWKIKDVAADESGGVAKISNLKNLTQIHNQKDFLSHIN